MFGSRDRKNGKKRGGRGGGAQNHAQSASLALKMPSPLASPVRRGRGGAAAGACDSRRADADDADDAAEEEEEEEEMEEANDGRVVPKDVAGGDAADRARRRALAGGVAPPFSDTQPVPDTACVPLSPRLITAPEVVASACTKAVTGATRGEEEASGRVMSAMCTLPEVEWTRGGEIA